MACKSFLAAGQNVVKAAYWFSGSEFPVSDIDSTQFTHLYCAFADLDAQTNQVTIASGNLNRFSTFTQTVQRRNPSVKTLLSIGGGGADKRAYASMASQAGSRKSFIDSSIGLARSYGFHGLDLDWEYPSTLTEMANFGALLREWRVAVNNEARNTGRSPLLLAAAVFYSSNYYSLDYPVQTVANSLDWINVMAYDFYGPGWSDVTGPPASLFNPSSQVNADSGIRAWIQSGMPSKKIVLGFPFYGYAWTLADANNHGYFAPTTGSAISKDGSIGYKQIRQFIVQNGATTVHDTAVVGDYCYAGRTWIGYDDYPTIVTKVRYAKYKGLLGMLPWMTTGDFHEELHKYGVVISTWYLIMNK
ncbi:PREDICTED: chitotriosidase-1 [Theobroma cacao]|uniref:Chitotriosidase-1 n=1 Tax=Theobroma cacao TaxID=3641 RepID=A0AB32WWZ0_THECC|nr:PREDICTED: chitotriosidase-1 [Theobroma cacao]